MPNNTNYLEISIGNQQVSVTDPEVLPFAIDYKLEDEEDFQVKKGSEATQIVIPASLMNSRVANGFDQVGVEDMTPDQSFKGFQNILVKHNGYELMVGKAVLGEAAETDKPESYTFDAYADNNDWVIALADATLWDFLKRVRFIFSRQTIVDSWQYDGRDENLPYVFAPIRYGNPMGTVKIDDEDVDDYNMAPEYMKPSVSKYWVIYWAFKSLGYQIQSTFFNSNYFRRQVMPWTWGNFLFSDGTRLSNLDFLAKSAADFHVEGNYTGYADLGITNTTTLGAFDNNHSYSYNASSKEATWTYLPQYNYGNLDATFHLGIYADAFARRNSDVELRARWFKNGAQVWESLLINLNAPTIGRRTFTGFRDDYVTINVNPGDRVSVMLYLHIFDSGTGEGYITMKAEAFEIDYFRIPLGGTIDFENYGTLKNYKFLDMLRGVVDEFNLTVKTDNITKTVLIEPTHAYKVPGDPVVHPGFFNGDFIDWNHKQDVSKLSKRILYKDYEREVIFRYKNDTNDGLQKTVQDRNTITLAAAKYVLPDRFKAGKKSMENRFFSPVMHYTVDQWKKITGTAPQMVAMVPENISNTSKDESQNTFLPKSCYYKGIIHGMGWVFDGSEETSFPFLFAVNYMKGGENDACLSYCDERTGELGSYKLVPGLLKTFFWQRMAIMRNGEWYNTWFNLKNYDVSGATHREFKICRNQRWELVSINNYSPLKQETTNVIMRRWVPVDYADAANTYPSQNSILKNVVTQTFDVKYSPLKALTSDIPR
jgi:hypothetical protein